MRIRFPDEPTEVTDASPLYPPAGTKLHVKAGAIYPRWLEVRLADVVVPPPLNIAKPAALDVARPAAPPRDLTQPRDLTLPGEVTQSGQVPQPSTQVTVDPEREARYQRVRGRIEGLNRLRKDGVLSEEQYQTELGKAMAELEK